jgi:hypothetical protein
MRLSEAISRPVIGMGSATGTSGNSRADTVRYCRNTGARLYPILSVADLPSPDTRRWVIARKAAVVAAVQYGVLSIEEACDRYSLSIEEYLCWQRLIERHGVAGLRVTRLREYRIPAQRDAPVSASSTKVERLGPVETTIPESG